MDLSKFFDTVDHDVLMYRVAGRVHDKRLLRLIGRYLRAGVEVKGRLQSTLKGVPQGARFPHFWLTFVLDDLDKELEKRGHRFVRYAVRLHYFSREPKCRRASDDKHQALP